MPLYGVGDVARAYDEGRVHTQMFNKTTSSVPSAHNTWLWGGIGTGNPGADPVVGTALTFTPRIVTNQNFGVYTGPTPPSGQTKHVVFAEVRAVTSSNVFLYENMLWFDLLGFYPLIDGSSADLQEMDNTLSLPRYADGDGVRAIIMTYVAASTGVGQGTMVYVGADGVERSTSVRCQSTSNLGSMSTSARTATAEAAWIPIDNSKGIRSIKNIQWDVAQPGGYYAIMLVRPLFNFVVGGAVLAGTTNAYPVSDKCFSCRNGALYPRILDGAALNFIWRHSGGGNATAFFGHLTFAWG